MDIAECDYEVNYDYKNTLNWIATFMARYISKGGGLPEFLLRVQSLYLQFVLTIYNLYPTICTLQFVPYSLYPTVCTLQFVRVCSAQF